MPKIPELHPALRGWLFDGPLAEHVPAYLARLSEGRYADVPARHQMRARSASSCAAKIGA